MTFTSVFKQICIYASCKNDIYTYSLQLPGPSDQLKIVIFYRRTVFPSINLILELLKSSSLSLKKQLTTKKQLCLPHKRSSGICHGPRLLIGYNVHSHERM